MYTVAMRAINDTYEYDVYEVKNDMIQRELHLTIDEVMMLFQDEVRNNIDALVMLNERAPELF